MRPLIMTAAVFACICALWTGTGEAKGKTVRLTHVASAVTEIEGRAALRIEIETNRPAGLSYALSEQYHAENQSSWRMSRFTISSRRRLRSMG